MERKKIGAIVLAAGSGSRMQSKVAKQYLPLDGKPLVYYALEQFQKSLVDAVVLVVSQGQQEYCRKEIVERYGLSKVNAIVEGGKERYDSVYLGLIALDECDYVLIHDGARPFLDQGIIGRMIDEVSTSGACIAAMPVKDTIKIANEECFAVNTPDRSMLWQIQTPQAFDYTLIRKAYEDILAQGADGITDDAQVLERVTGKYSKLVKGSYMNIKVTTPEDLLVAEAFLGALKNIEKI